MTVVAPTLILTSDSTDRTPNFQVTGDIQVGDLERLSFGTSPTFVGATEVTNQIDSAEFAASSFSWSTGTLGDGTWYFRARTERAGDISPWSNTQSVTLGAGAIVLSPSALPNGTVGVPYSQVISASNGTGPYTFALASGALPTGLSLNASTGAITGTPSAAATYSFSIKATDSLAAFNSQPYNVTIATAVAAQFLFGDIVLDQGLTALSLADKMHLCSSLPTDYAGVTSNTLGNKNLGPGNVFGPINAGVGRERASIPFNAGSITLSGTAGYWAAVDSVNSRLLAAGSVAVARAVTSGSQFSMPAITVGLKRA